MVQGIRFRDGTVIDFQDTEWSIEVDTVSDEVVFEHSASGNTYTYGSSGEFSASELNFTDEDLTVQTLALGTTLVTDTESPYTTSGEGIIFADSSVAPVEVVLASADRRDGLGVTVIDVGGAAGTNAITISTEGSETIDGSASSLIEAEYGAKRLASDGTDWFSAGGGSGAGGVAVEDDGSLVLDPAKNINFGNALSVSDDGDNTVTVDGVQYTDEQAQDAVSSALTGGDKVGVTYDDSNDTITVDTSALDAEEVEDQVNSLVSGGDAISTTYDDVNDNLTISLDTSTSVSFPNGIDSLPTPQNNDEAARKQYVDAVAEGLNLKDSVAVSDHDQQIDLTGSTDPNPIDGYTLQDGERILLKHQNDATENGIYDAVTATDPSTWVRSADFDSDEDVTEGSFTFIRNGDTHSNEAYVVTSPDPITVGTDDINWSQFSFAGEFSGGDGIDKTNSTFSVNVSDLAGDGLQDDGGNDLELINNSLSVVSGDGLKNGGLVSLGGSTTLDIEPADFAGSGLGDDGSDNLRVEQTPIEETIKFGAEGATTTSSTYVTITDSDIALDFSDYQDVNGNLEVKIIAHLSHAETGTTYLRMYRQNAGTAVTGTEVSHSPSSTGKAAWGFAESGWVDLSSESGFESYQLQLRSSDGNTCSYNSVLLQMRT